MKGSYFLNHFLNFFRLQFRGILRVRYNLITSYIVLRRIQHLINNARCHLLRSLHGEKNQERPSEATRHEETTRQTKG